MGNRYDNAVNYVPAVAQPQRPTMRVDESLMRHISESPSYPIVVEDALHTHEGAKETTSGRDRAIALILRLGPFSIVWLVLAVAVGWAAGMEFWFVLLLFSGLTSVTYAWLDRQEYQFSRNGLERHKVNTLAGLKRDEMRHQQELRRMAMRAHLKMLGVADDDD